MATNLHDLLYEAYYYFAGLLTVSLQQAYVLDDRKQTYLSSSAHVKVPIAD